MKRLFIIFSLAIFMLIIIPSNTYAATNFVEKDGYYVNDSAISAGVYGEFAAGDVKWHYTDADNGIKEWQYTLTAKANLNSIYITLVPNALNIQKIQAGDSFLLTTSATNAKVLLIPNNGSIKSGSKVLLFTVTTKDTAEDGCMLNVSPGATSCVEIDGTYLDKDGKPVDKDKYDEVCNGITPSTPSEPEDPGRDVPSSPDTGSVVPYLAIGGGIVAIIGVYIYSYKKNKVYKI